MGKTRMKFVQPNHSSGASAFGDGDGGGGGGGAGGGGSYGTIGGSSSRNDYGNVARNGGGHSRHMHSTNNRPLYADEFIPGPKQSLRSTAMAHITSSKKNQSPTPRSAHGRSAYGGTNGHNNGGGSKRNTRALPSPRYGADDEGDDERVPLMSTRHERNRPRHNNSLNGNNRRPQSASLRQLEHNQRRRSCIGRFASCFIAVITICLVIAGTIGFMFATSKPLQDVKVLNMTDVLVSQQEIMLDLLVQAVNPNVIGVTVQAMDVNVFAKSSWVRDDKDKDKDPPEDGDEDEKVSGGDVEDTLALSEHFPLLHEVAVENDIARRSAPSLTTKHLAVRGWRELLNPIPKKGVDEGTDPDPNLPDQEDRQTMLLGRIFQFDSALSFDGSPLQRRPSTSQGGIRLAKPGNKTEIGGTERWERVILHPFELIVRGVLKYQLPLNGRVRTASIGASVMVNPAADELVEGLREVVWAG